MADAGGRAAAEQPADEEDKAGSNMFNTLFRALMIYFVFTTFLKKPKAAESVLVPSPSPAAAGARAVDGGDGAAVPAGLGKAAAKAPVAGPPYTNLLRMGQELELRVYLSEWDDRCDFADKAALVWQESELLYNWQEENTRTKNVTIPATAHLQSNGSLFAHTFFLVPGVSPDPSDAAHDRYRMVHDVHQLNRHQRRKKVKVLKKLSLFGSGAGDLDPTRPKGESEEEAAAAAARAEAKEAQLAREATGEDEPVINYWKPTLAVSLVLDHTAYARNAIPEQIATSMEWVPDKAGYIPKLYFNDFWIVDRDLVALNSTVDEVVLQLRTEPISLMKWQMQESMEKMWEDQRKLGTGGKAHEVEILKDMLVETSPWLLMLTGVVSVLHTVFDMLAFKNDIGFWRNRKTMEGLSAGSIVRNAFNSCVIWLYLFNSDEVSFIIMMSVSISTMIEIWKITKIATIELLWADPRTKVQYFAPRPHFMYVRSYQTTTQKYDEIATTYLSLVLYPLVFGYAVFSLLYSEHKSWYAWFLGSLVGGVYTFGFITMTPQLYINYRMKSVAHMPWRQMTYKTLGTFIDDLFAFIIKMPTLHRLACFRDDIIFFIFLYQRYIYAVDPTRANEYGRSADDYEQYKQDKADGKIVEKEE